MTLDRLVPMLSVRDLTRSIEFYLRLGFELEDRNDDWGWAKVRQSRCELMLDLDAADDDGAAASHRSVIYLYPHDIAAYHRQARAGGLEVPDLSVTFYGMTEFRLDDPDGNHLWVGQEVPAATG